MGAWFQFPLLFLCWLAALATLLVFLETWFGLSGRRVQTRFPEKPGGSPGRRASRGKEAGTETTRPYFSSNLSVIIFQSLIQLAGCFTIGQTIVGDFIEAALLEIIPNFASIDAVFWGIHSENFAEKLERALTVTLEIR